MRNLAIALTLLLGACVNPNNSVEVRSIQRVTQVCASYDATLRSLAIMRPRLSEAQVGAVDRWRPIMNGICTGEVPDIAADSLLDTAEKALFELNRIERAAQ